MSESKNPSDVRLSEIVDLQEWLKDVLFSPPIKAIKVKNYDEIEARIAHLPPAHPARWAVRWMKEFDKAYTQ